MSTPNQQHVPQPTISGYNVEEERSFQPEEDIAPFEHPSPILSHEDDTFEDDSEYGSDSLESPDMSLGDELRAEKLHDEVKQSFYMPWHVLRAIMTRDKVANELKKHYYREDEVQKYTDLICPEVTQGLRGAYTKVFAALARLDKCQDIDKFVSEGLSDEKLPFGRKEGSARIRRDFVLVENTDPPKEIRACKHWKPDDRDRFFSLQREFLVHFFKHRPGHDSTAISGTTEPQRNLVEEISDATYLPWKRTQMKTAPMRGMPTLNPGMSSSYAVGAYGSVAPFDIGDKDHDFGELLDKVSSRHFQLWV